MSLHLLVVEDVEIAQKMAKMILVGLGYSVDVAADGETALSMFKQTRYDLIFMDIGLPGIDGFETTRAIRQVENGSIHTPIIALTANFDSSHRSMCLESGMDEFLSKPLNKNKAQDMIRTFIHA